MPEFITREAFRAWLDSMPDDAKPCADRRDCPLRAATGFGIGFTRWHNDHGRVGTLPNWAYGFRVAVDTLTDDREARWADLTVADIRRVLDEVPA